MLWSDFVAAVKNRYSASAYNERTAQQAVAFAVKSLICREVDADLPLAKSYLDSYTTLKFRLAGYTITSDFTTTKTAVLVLLTVDASRAAISSYIDAQIQKAMDDINATAAPFNAAVVSAVVDLQRHVDCYRVGHETFYLAGDVAPDGRGSSGTLPDGAIAEEFSYLLYGAPLAAGVTYKSNDIVESNDRLYIVVTGGALTSGQIGSGLTSTSGQESLGALVFAYTCNCASIMTGVKWRNRKSLTCDCPAVNFGYSINPEGNQFIVRPGPDDKHQVRLVWSGLKTTFSDSDSTPFDPPAADAAAEYVRMVMAKNVAEDTRAMAAAAAEYAAMLKRCWIDCGAKKGAGML